MRMTQRARPNARCQVSFSDGLPRNSVPKGHQGRQRALEAVALWGTRASYLGPVRACAVWLSAYVWVGTFAGCVGPGYMANKSAAMLAVAEPAVASHWDAELVAQALPGQILQLEGLLRASPENLDLTLGLARAYLGYAYGVVEEELEQRALQSRVASGGAGGLDALAEATDPSGADLPSVGELSYLPGTRAQVLRDRASRIYERVRVLGGNALEQVRPGYIEAKEQGPAALERYSAALGDGDHDAALLLATGLGWGAWIQMQDQAPAAVAELPLARVLVLRAVELAPELDGAAGLIFLGSVAAALPKAAGGDAEHARVLFERALELTDGEALGVHLAYAREVAVRHEDKALFSRLIGAARASGVPPGSGGARFRLANAFHAPRLRRLTQTHCEWLGAKGCAPHTEGS